MGVPAGWESVFVDKGMIPARLDAPHLTPYQEQRIASRTTKLVTAPPDYVNGVELVLPIRVVSEANQSEGHWSHRHKRFKAQAVVLVIALLDVKLPAVPVVAYWTKLGGQKMDGDNLSSAFKGLRDALAKRYGVDDGSDSIRWQYDQDPGGPHGVRLLVTRSP